MALSKSFQKGQTVLECQMCEEESKIKWKCLLCNLLICDKCRKIHQKFKSTEEHKIVDLKNIASEQKQLELVHDFNNIKCDRHAGKICCLFCTVCEEVVCPLCITNAHNTHNMIEISEGFKVAMEVLRDLNASTDEDLTKLKTKRVTLQSLKTEVQSKYSEEKQGILQQEKVFNELVHKQSEKLVTTLDEGLNKITISMQANENQTNEDYKAAELRKQIFLDAIDSNNVLTVFKIVGKEKIAKKTLISQDNLAKYESLPKFVPGCIEQKGIATFYGTLVDIPAQPIAKTPQFKLLIQYSTTLPLIQCIVCCPNGSLWISNFTSNEMQNISLLKDGSTQLDKNVKLSEVARMQLNKSDLILSLQKSNLYIFQPETGKLVSSKYTVAPLMSNSALHISKNNKIIVGAREQGPMFPPDGPRKVIVMNMEGEHETTYYLDNKGRPIFTLPFRITTNNDNGIFVIDLFSHDDGRVVKLNKVGGVSSIYLGNPVINSSHQPFLPHDLKTTLANNVIVTDYSCNTLHVINSMVHCIYYIRIDRQFGITSPLSLEIDNNGVLFIGTCESHKSEAKIYEMKISGV